MGASATPIQHKELSDIEIIRSIPNDQYTCTECPMVPEILNIYYNTNEIEFCCQAHGIKKIPLRDYFLSENKFIYNNVKCQICKEKKPNQKSFKYCYHCNKNLCFDCSIRHNDHKELINFNDVNNKCNEHKGDCEFLLYCFTCKKNICSSMSEIDHKEHKKDVISKFRPDKNDLKIIKNNINICQKDLELLECLVKINKTLVETYELHPNNYYHNINLTNLYKSLTTSNYDDYFNSRTKNREIIKEFNEKYDKKISGYEKILDLKDLNLGNDGLVCLRKNNFENLEILNLENNNISDIVCFSKWKLKRLKELNLSNNEIKDISIIKEILNICTNMEKINLNNNKINDIKILDNEEIINNRNLKEIIIRNNKVDYNSTEVKNIINKFKGRIKR